MPNPKKIETVKQLKEKLQRVKSVVFSDYQGLTVSQMQELKKQVKKEGGEFLVTKNTLLKRSLGETKFPPLEEKILEGPTAALFSYQDEISPLKALALFAKSAGLPKLKAGILEKIILTKERLEELSLLPPKNILMGKVIDTIAGPTYGLISVLNGNIRKLTYVLGVIKK